MGITGRTWGWVQSRILRVTPWEGDTDGVSLEGSYGFVPP